MGKELFLSKMEKKRKLLITLGIILGAGGLLTCIISIAANFSPGVTVFSIMAFILGVILLIVSPSYRGENCSFIRSQERILELTDDLYKTTVYQDDFVIVSEQAIGNKNDIFQTGAREDVVGIFEKKSDGVFFFIMREHTVHIAFRNRLDIVINVLGKKPEKWHHLYDIVAQYCPNAMIGYSLELERHMYTERKAYRLSRKNRK